MPTSWFDRYADDASLPQYRRLYLGLREAIMSGTFSAGERLPSSRTLSRHLGMSRSTVVESLDQLVAEGYVFGRQGSGMFVADLPSSPHRLPERLARGRTTRVRDEIETLSASVSVSAPPLRPFRMNVPDIRLFPLNSWMKISRMVLRDFGAEMLDYPHPNGHVGLRQVLAKHLWVTRGIQVSSDRIMITEGTRHAINLLLPLLVDPGDIIWVEEPGYPGIRQACRLLGVKVVGIPVGSEGIDLEAVTGQLPLPRAVYVTPSHQYPLGMTMTARVRLELLKWAKRHGIYLIEDDYDSEYRYQGHPLASLHSMDSGDTVVYLGTFSKTLAPGLTMGYSILPAPLAEDGERLRRLVGHGTSPFNQAVVHRFIESGQYAKHLHTTRMVYAERQRLFLEMAKVSWPGVSIEESPAGLDVIAWLPEGVDDTEMALQLNRLGIESAPLSSFTVKVPLRPALILGYAAYTEPELAVAVERSSRVFRAI